MPVEVEALLAENSADWSDTQHGELLKYFLKVTPELAEVRSKIDRLRRQLPELPTTMVMQERPADNRRPTFRHHRGEYLSPREVVKPGVPEMFHPLLGDPPENRLELARWLVSSQNPLGGRVAVNRAWQSFFGHGLMKAAGDFGTQSEPPSHPDLLDWLASRLPSRGWSLKALHRLIVTSATYRQSSQCDPELRAQDPQNRLLGRGPKFRVEAELVRDIILQASGLLSTKMYGPSVYPPQPASVTGLAYGGTPWNASVGEDRYRRSLYTFCKRTAPFAAYSAFDAPSGENCLVGRERSNTPLQALTLLNDEMFLEMARGLAVLACRIELESAGSRAEFIFRRLLTRPPDARELAALVAFHRRQRQRMLAGELDPAAICGDEQADAERAAWVMVARAVMNLDETINRR